MLDAARGNLDAAGVADPIRAVVADAGYSNKQNRTRPAAEGNSPILLVAVPRLGKAGRGPGEENLPKSGGGPLTSKDDPTVGEPGGEPAVCAPQDHRAGVWPDETARRAAAARHRGRDKVNTEWKMMAAAHNLLKCWRYQAWQPV